MKKVIVGAYILFLSLLLYGISVSADEVEYTDDWVNWSQHHMTGIDNYLMGYDVFQPNTANELKPWYIWCLDDDSKGITIRVQKEGTNDQYIYLSFSNTASIWRYNRAANQNTYYQMAKWTGQSTLIDGQFENYFHLSGKVYYWSFPLKTDDFHVDITCTSSADLYQQLSAMGFQNPAGITGQGQLPLLTYTLERKLIPQLSLNVMTVKEILKWNFEEKEPYKSAPSNYTFEIWASANWTNAPDGIGRIWDSNNYTLNPENKVVVTDGGNNLSINEFSFAYDDVGKSVYNRSNKDWRNDSINAPTLGYFIYVRNKTNDGSQVSVWKIFKVQAGGYVTSVPTVMNPDGTYSDANSIEDGTDGLDPGNNGTTPYDPDNSTTAGSDPSSELYDGEGQFNLSTMINSLKSMINSLKDIPNILSQLLTFLPDWLTTLLVLSIGMFVVVGTVRLLLKG